MSENEFKTETKNDFANIENVSAKDLAGIEFPPVNTAAVAASVRNDTPAEIPSAVPPSAPDGWDGNIHAFPPRKNKRGEWAKKRGNKKGYVFGKPKNENPPPLNIPPDAEKVAAEAARAAEVEKKTCGADAGGGGNGGERGYFGRKCFFRIYSRRCFSFGVYRRLGAVFEQFRRR